MKKRMGRLRISSPNNQRAVKPSQKPVESAPEVEPPFSLPAAAIPDASTIVHLQHVIGNQAVQRLLAARAAENASSSVSNTSTADGPLSAGQVRDAIAYYKARPQRYTRDIIMQIQMEMGTVPTGRISALDVQAVAKRQQELNTKEKPPLKVDGKAGPRTLPAVFKFGLAEDKAIKSYTKEAHDMWQNKQGKSEEDIAKAIVDKLNTERLKPLGIPPIKCDVKGGVGGRGTFSSADWVLNLDDRQFKEAKLHDLKETTSTIYHEARHAEQDFRIGQMLAGRHKTAEQIHAETGLNLKVAKDAANLPLKPGTMEAVIAEGWYDSLYGDAGIERRNRNSAELRAAFKAREAAEKANIDHPTPENAAKLAKAKARYDKAVAEHDDLPHEFDAERVEAKVDEQYDQP
jgi:hypothetical protein